MKFIRVQFIGLALSACWALGVTVYQRQTEMPKAQQYAMTAYYLCAERQASTGNHDLNPCLESVDKDWDKWMNRKWRDIAFIALTPIVSTWLLGFVCIRLYRWKKPRTMT